METKLMQPFVHTICASCAELLVSPAITEPHQHMTAQYKQTSQDGHSDGEYTCLECESVWRLRFSCAATLVEAELIGHSAIGIANALAECPRPFRCSGNLATCPLLATSSPH